MGTLNVFSPLKSIGPYVLYYTIKTFNNTKVNKMAFRSASGWNNLPNGNFSPVIYSQKVQLAFRKSSVVQDITNNDLTK